MGFHDEDSVFQVMAETLWNISPVKWYWDRRLEYHERKTREWDERRNPTPETFVPDPREGQKFVEWNSRGQKRCYTYDANGRKVYVPCGG